MAGDACEISINSDRVLEIECNRLEKGLFTFMDDIYLTEMFESNLSENILLRDSGICKENNLNESDRSETEILTEFDDFENLEEFIRQFESILDSNSESNTSFISQTKPNPIPFYNTSLFFNTPPTINFPYPDQQIEHFPAEAKPFLLWKHSAITPNIVRSCVREAGFKSTPADQWIGYFGKHMKTSSFKSLSPSQKFNHFPGSFQLGRKDNLWRNLTKLQLKHSRHEFSFLPHTYVLPADYEAFSYRWESADPSTRWIRKPLASARGIGVELVQNLSDIPKDKPMIVQQYITNPLLVDGYKCDLRIYVYVTSFDPLRVYIYNDGVVRFATEKYSNSTHSLSNQFMHLTNYSINKTNPNFILTTDGSQAEGHKWTLNAFWRILRQKGIDTNIIWEEIKSIALKTIISVESCINTSIKNNVKYKDCVHELFGFDVMLDEFYKPWLLEVNISPSLHSVSKFDVSLKAPLVANLLTLAGYKLPQNTLHYNLTSNERYKHAYFAKKGIPKSSPSKILNTLTPDDIRMLIETEDERNRAGNFEALFPTDQSEKYLAYFSIQRYYNLLLYTWYTSQYGGRDRGINKLKSLSDIDMHTTRNPPKHHTWNPSIINVFKPLKHITMKKCKLSIFSQKRSLNNN